MRLIGTIFAQRLETFVFKKETHIDHCDQNIFHSQKADRVIDECGK